MPLSPQQKSYLKYLGDLGDAAPKAIYEAIQAGAERIVVLTDVAQAAAANVVSSVQDNAANALTVALGTLVHARNVTCTFGASWAGGDITVVGTDQFGAAQTEVIADTANTLVEGTKIFKTITSVTKELTGAGGAGHTVTVGMGNKLGLGVQLHNSFGAALRNNATLAVPGTVNTLDTTNHAITLTSTDVPGAAGTDDYQVLCRVVI